MKGKAYGHNFLYGTLGKLQFNCISMSSEHTERRNAGPNLEWNVRALLGLSRRCGSAPMVDHEKMAWVFFVRASIVSEAFSTISTVVCSRPCGRALEGLSYPSCFLPLFPGKVWIVRHGAFPSTSWHCGSAEICNPVSPSTPRSHLQFSVSK